MVSELLRSLLCVHPLWSASWESAAAQVAKKARSMSSSLSQSLSAMDLEGGARLHRRRSMHDQRLPCNGTAACVNACAAVAAWAAHALH